jgi:YggT family protein
MKSILILFDTIVNIYLWVVIINAILSWLVAFSVLNSSNRLVSTALEVSQKLTDPLLNQIRKYLPIIAGLDFSPVVLILLLMFIRNLLFEIFAPGLF